MAVNINEGGEMIKAKLLWPIIGGICILGMLIASCSSGSTTTTSTSKTTSATSATKTTTSTTAAEKPKYGGTINLLYNGTDFLGFDEGYNAPWFCIQNHLTEDEMLNGDWTQGPAGGYGSNKWTWTLDGIYNWSSKTGWLCDTWQVLTPYHWTFHVRDGVHFSVDPNNEASKLINGRLITADDIVYSYNRLCTLQDSYIYQAHPYFTKNLKMTATDKSNIDLVVPNDADSIYQIAQIVVDWNGTIAKEVIDKWGNMKDWKHAHGSGPYMLTDFVSGSSATFTKNPNYWDTNPIGPGKGDKLPYADTVKIFIIGDSSTQLSALRTGKIDTMNQIGVDDAKSMEQTTPQLQKLVIPSALSFNQIFMRTDKTDLPYHLKEVRQALLKATDYPTIVNTLYSGKGVYPTFPCPPLPDLKENVLSLKDASAAIQDLYKYDPDKAKAMLKEAGYPDGWTANIVCQNNETYVDYLSVIKDQWSKVGITLNISQLEFGVYMNRWVARDYDELFYGGMASAGTFRTMVSSQGSGGGYNLSYIVDDRLANGMTDMLTAFNAGDDAKCAQIHKGLCEIIYEEAYAISTPAQDSTTFWWPWLKNYSGETAHGILNGFHYAKYLWIDQDLKKSMGK
jgi:peptide/nickel transport system substrate-binding protein